ncbi:hypothetical protein N7491_008700 [Penicillium cf. griseofulvum]|uniref:Protein kinase domain-containing protein n=1 Tax=Penicillium cf. griseofulvum TaxID=2972120 RepID=A0A9W9JQQ1_9EURO|nr:hypothetical protein N7472_005698 [Penicillium cf. griseofulvum]KAJ5423484.1 hypothetical protein N7491_008700 [Penicillium cf. griseofulvum]
MNRRHPHRIRHNQQLVDCPLGLRPTVHRRVYSIGLSRRAHRAQIRTKQKAANGDLAKLHPPHLSRHMLVMGWGDERTTPMGLTPILLQEIHKSTGEIKALGVIHKDLRRDNILWNEELGRALIIEFHRSTLESRPTLQRPRAVK